MSVFTQRYNPPAFTTTSVGGVSARPSVPPPPPFPTTPALLCLTCRPVSQKKEPPECEQLMRALVVQQPAEDFLHFDSSQTLWRFKCVTSWDWVSLQCSLSPAMSLGHDPSFTRLPGIQWGREVIRAPEKWTHFKYQSCPVKTVGWNGCIK